MREHYHNRPVTHPLLVAILACVFSTWLATFGFSGSIAGFVWGFFIGSSLVWFLSPELLAAGAAAYDRLNRENIPSKR